MLNPIGTRVFEFALDECLYIVIRRVQYKSNLKNRKKLMIFTHQASRGMVVAPHHLAAQAGLAVLREGGNAIEAMLAAASTIAVVYPHMNGLGGDNFWLIHHPDAEPVAIDACGAAAAQASIEFYRQQGMDAIPARGPLAALTVAGAVAGWDQALKLSTSWGGRLPLERLLKDALYYARHGVPVSLSQHRNTLAKQHEMDQSSGFDELYLTQSETGSLFQNPALADTLQQLMSAGLDDFYRGELARTLAADLEQIGSPLRLNDLNQYRASQVDPLHIEISQGMVYNLPPPTQGLASLMILGLFDRLPRAEVDSFEYIHGLIEATKQAFRVRDQHITDPAYLRIDPLEFLSASRLDELAANIDLQHAAPWPHTAKESDTVWLGAIDAQGRAVSFIQSLYWEFGSGVVLPNSGIAWQNRGTSFSLDPKATNPLTPGRKPFHTIQPALAKLKDGRVMPYGTMGGEGQPQTQAMVFTRYARFGQSLQHAVTAPRWLLGRTWGSVTTNLRLENRFDPVVIEALRKAGHDIEVIGAFDEVMGHAGALVWHPNGLIEGAADPRSDGSAAGF